MFYTTSFFILLTELSNRIGSINPCTNPKNDFVVMGIETDHNYQVIDEITKKARVLERVEGCCSSLSPILRSDNLKNIMDVMRFSIGTTIPNSHRNSTDGFEMVDMSNNRLFPLDKIAAKLKYRYI